MLEVPLVGARAMPDLQRDDLIGQLPPPCYEEKGRSPVLNKRDLIGQQSNDQDPH